MSSYSASISRVVTLGLLALALAVPATTKGAAIPTALSSYEPWPEETVATFRELLIQDGGRVKPIDTFARFTQLAYLGKRSVTFSTADGKDYKIDSAEWLLNVLFRPEVARHLPSFVVDDSHAVEEIGVDSKKLRDRYSYGEISEGRAKLAEKAEEYAKQQAQFEQAKERKSDDAAKLELTRIQTMVLMLGKNVSSFDYLSGQMSFAQQGKIMSAGMLPDVMKQLAESIDVMEVIERLPEMSMEDLVRTMQNPGGEGDDAQLLQMSLQLLFFYARSGDLVHFFPPPRGEYPNFTAEEIRKPKNLAKRLVNPDEADTLSPYVWSLLPAEAQKSLADESTSEEDLRTLLQSSLNDIIGRGESIYEEQRFAAGSIEKVTRELMESSPEGGQLTELNRKLLHDYYRSELGGRIEKWLTIGEVITLALESKEMRPWARERLSMMQDLARASDPATSAEFQDKLVAFKSVIDKEAAARWEGEHAATEVKFYQKDYFTNSMVFFTLGFVALALSWLAPGSKFAKFTYWVAIICSVVALGYLVLGITMRCIIRERPPITNLYETIIFIAAISVIVALFAEWITKMSIGLAAAVILGSSLMFLSIRYEAMEASDTMGQLQAVLDTNFWLATHVTIINIGYAAGMLAAIVSHFWIIGKMFGLGDKANYKTITSMVYGIVCFCLLFSLVGTVLGGIWANYSWGRFWGWDPKENGALMIVLFSLVILHARMGGFIRQLGMHLSSIFLGVVVTFSWWGVNNLGVGLHSYGFTEGVWRNLFIFWIIELMFMILAVISARKPLFGFLKLRPRPDNSIGAV